jgi:predicted transcriptional regulator of viral defense system
MATTKICRDFYSQGLFTFEELAERYAKENTKKTLRNLVYQGLKKSELGIVKRGLYFLIPPGQEPAAYRPDPFLIASKLGSNPVLAYHSALALHGAAHSESNRIYFFTPTITRKFEFGGVEYVPVQRKALWGTETVQRDGGSVKVTDRERTVLDCVDRPDYAGGLEELLKSLELFPSLDLERLEHNLWKINKRILFSKMGFLLERMKDQWKVSEGLFAKIEKKCGKGTTYFETKKGQGVFVSRWRLIVPKNLESLSRGV